jgi:hypothetical protein
MREPRTAKFNTIVHRSIARIIRSLGPLRLVEDHKAIGHHDLCRSITPEQQEQAALSGTGQRMR